MQVIVKLTGGIGNQLFQYVFAKGIANKFNGELLVDLSSFVNYSYHHDFELKKLIPEISIADNILCAEKKGTYFLYENNASSLSAINILPEDCEILVINGYWQNEKYIDKSIINEIYNKLNDKYEKITTIFEGENKNNFVALHIRRRDYKHMGLCSEEYYIGCLQYLKETTNINSIFLFSDEPNYSLHVLNNYFTGQIKLIKTGDDFHDMYVMSQCKNIIISNSTYSWWGAYFNEENKNIILNPDPWILVDNATRPCPQRWVAVENSLIKMDINLDKIKEIKSVIYDKKSVKSLQ
jgi:hypothetical protein